MQELLEAGTAVVCDVLDANGVRPSVLSTDLFAVAAPRRFVGRAFTVTGRAESWEGGDRLKLEAIDAMTPGCVAVWAGGDIGGTCCFGDLLATSMRARDVAGVVVDGGVRDAAYLADLGLGIHARYLSPAQAIGRWRVTGYETPVMVRGAIDDWVRVEPGDVIIVDDDGAVAVTQALAAHVAGEADEWAGGEEAARRDIANGLPLLAALEKYGHL